MVVVNSQSLEGTHDVYLIDPNDGPYSKEVIQRLDGSRDYLWLLEIKNPLENTENYGLTSYLQTETMTRIGAEQLANIFNSTERSSGRNTKQTIDTVRTNAPAKPVLTRVRTKIKKIETVLKKAAIKPYHNINGQIEGLRISGLDKILAAKELLLKSGDVICVVNGQPLSSKIRAYKIFKRARKLSTMEIELLRDGKSQTLLYYLR
jgi:hypothetical protein